MRICIDNGRNKTGCNDDNIDIDKLNKKIDKIIMSESPYSTSDKNGGVGC